MIIRPTYKISCDEDITVYIKNRIDQFKDRVALRSDSGSHTYQSLWEISDQIAFGLISKGIGKGDLVPLFVDNGIEQVIVMLGILKSGAAYVPIPADFPIERVVYILKETAPKLVFGKPTAYEKQTWSSYAWEFITNEQIFSLKPDERRVSELPVLSLQDLAYVIYTSGSTGQPKGVMIEHGSLMNYLLNAMHLYIPDGKAKTLHHLSLAFDASITSIFLPLICGGTVSLITTHYALQSANNGGISQEKYSFLKTTPSIVKLFSDTVVNGGAKLANTLIFGGEPLFQSAVKDLIRSGITIINEYGPTEATVGCSACIVRKDAGQRGTSTRQIPIGKPFANCTFHIMNDHLEYVEADEVGELYISGVQIARGYLKDEQLTRERFIDNPHNPGERLYRSGDLVRWTKNEDLEFAGRLDEQVKINGYRVELGEIESTLLEIPDVFQAKVVFGKETGSQLLAFGVIDNRMKDTEVFEFLRSRLPGYMLPVHIIRVNEMPLTTNVKLDTKALIEFWNERSAEGEFLTEPDDGLEQNMIALWKEILHLEEVDLDDDFFSIGGDSLSAVRLIAKMKREMSVQVSINALFDLSTIRALIGHIRLQQPKEDIQERKRTIII